MIRRDFLGYIAVLVFLSFYMSGCTRYYNPTGTNYSKANKYYNPSPQTKTTSGINNSNRYSTTSSEPEYNRTPRGYDKYGKGVNNSNYRETRDKNRYSSSRDDYTNYPTTNNTNTRRGRGKNRYNNSRNNDNYNDRSINNPNYKNSDYPTTTNTTNDRRNMGKNRYSNKRDYYDTSSNNKRGSYSRPAVVHENFTNDPRYEYHMDKRRFFYKPRPKIPYYYKDGIYYYGGYYNNGSYEYRGTTFTDGEYHGFK